MCTVLVPSKLLTIQYIKCFMLTIFTVCFYSLFSSDLFQFRALSHHCFFYLLLLLLLLMFIHCDLMIFGIYYLLIVVHHICVLFCVCEHVRRFSTVGNHSRGVCFDICLFFFVAMTFFKA